MAINDATVKLTTSSTIRARLSTGGTGSIQATAPISLKTAPNRLDMLSDVIEGSPQDGFSLVYRAADDKYVVQQLQLNDLSGNLDGGTF